MNAKQLYHIISPKIKKLIKDEWRKAYLKIMSEKNVQEYGAYYVLPSGEEKLLDPADYFLDRSELIAIQEFQTHANNIEEKKWNRLKFCFYPDGVFECETEWDEQRHQQAVAYNKAMDEFRQRQLKKPSGLHHGSGHAIHKQYKPVDAPKKSMHRVLNVDMTTPNITGEFFARLYSQFGAPTHVRYEGFTYFLIEKDADKIIGAELSAIGLGYLAEDESEESVNRLKEFHQNLFLPGMKLKNCKIEIENDFGKLIIGASNEVPYEKQIEE